MRRLLTVLLGLVVIATCFSAPSGADARAPRPHRTSAATAPALQVTTVVRGLDIPWDVKAAGGKLLITERSTRRLLTLRKGKLRRVNFPSSMVWARGETGLMGLAVDPAFKKNHRFYTCQGGVIGNGRHDVRVMAWKLKRHGKRATLIRPLLTGLPSTSGRHGGCRLLIATNGALFVGTGDAATGTNPRNLNSLGGKTLRLNRFTGAPWPQNPWIRSSSRNARYVLTFGHRNVQGLAQRADGSLWSVEHGPTRDDEVNKLTTGGDYGWNPVPGYNEGVPMTDQSLPGTQIGARWRSGNRTLATSGATFIRGQQWGLYNGTLAVAALKGSRLMFMRFDANGKFSYVKVPPTLRRFGRLRSVTQLGNGDLLVTTANGGSRDAVLRVHPVG
jgi:glucose/arabinose dehydrogenase